jgi:hypothetical protein
MNIILFFAQLPPDPITNPDYSYVINGWQVLAIMGPSILSIIAIIIKGFFDKQNQIRVNTKIENIADKQDIQHNKTNGRFDELIESVKKTSYALGMSEGVKNEQLRLENKLARALEGHAELINDAKIASEKLIIDAKIASNKLITDAKITKEKLND